MHFTRQLKAIPDLRESVHPFLLSQGFVEQGDLRYKRSSQLRTVVAFDPSQWQVVIEIDPVMKRLDMTVSTDGQIVTPRERAYFNAFFAEILQLFEGRSSATALAIRGPNALSHRAAVAALNENIAVMLGFFMSLPIQVIVLHFALALPMVWSIVWASIGSIAIAYAVLFSVKNRTNQTTPRK